MNARSLILSTLAATLQSSAAMSSFENAHNYVR